MKKVVFIRPLVGIILLASIILTGCGKHTGVTPNDPNQFSSNPLINKWTPNELEFGQITSTDTVLTSWQFGGSMPASNLTFTATNYTWGTVSGNWTVTGTQLQFNSNDVSTPTNYISSNFSGSEETQSYTATVRTVSSTTLVLEFTGTFYYHPPNGSAAAYTGVERITYAAQ